MFPTKTIYNLIGTSKSGKSYLLEHILKTLLASKQLKFGIVFTATKFNAGYSFLPDKYVYPDFDMDTLQDWLRFLVRIKKSGKDIPPSFIVFDDIIASIPQATKPWTQFLTTFRHFNITLFFTTQYPNMATPLLRSQTEYAYLFQITNDKQCRATYEAFGTLLPNVKAWKEFLNRHTGDYKCVIYHRDAPPRMDAKYKSYKAPSKQRNIRFEY
jgi:hypothetical protein